MPVTQSDKALHLIHPKGATADILFYGATVTSWKSASRTSGTTEIAERLFVSGKASLDGSKPVRGGIPLVFPVFGPPSRPEYKLLSQHGFARSESWEMEEIVMDNEAGVSVKLALTPSGALKEKFPFSAKLAYIVTLAEHQLTSHLQIENTGGQAFSFQALLHTYFRVRAQAVGVKPLTGLAYINKTKPGIPRETEARDAVDVHNFTDSVYENAGGDYDILVNGQTTVHVKTSNFPDVVVWNPGKENGAKMGDMEEGGWDNFICVEPGAVSSFVELDGGKTWSGWQTLTAA